MCAGALLDRGFITQLDRQNNAADKKHKEGKNKKDIIISFMNDLITRLKLKHGKYLRNGEDLAAARKIDYNVLFKIIAGRNLRGKAQTKLQITADTSFNVAETNNYLLLTTDTRNGLLH